MKTGEFETIPDWDFQEDVKKEDRPYNTKLYLDLVQTFSDLKKEELEYLIETKNMEAKDAAKEILREKKNKENAR